MDRRNLFSSLFSLKSQENKELILRPPYYKQESSFSTECLTCENKPCISSCPENIIILTNDGTPKLTFGESGCTYCDECAINCPTGVLDVENKQLIKANVEIDMLGCVSWKETMCFSCKDPCLEDAIEFLGIYKPSINSEKCTNCGFCVSRCPADAIVVE